MVDQVRAIIKGLDEVSEKVIRKITLDIVANLIGSTPVDTGWARANWVPSIGLPVQKNLRNVQVTPQRAAGARGSQQSAIGRITGYRLPMGSVFISNNVPYIMRLNDGSSKQEPAGFVQRAIRKAATQDIKGIAT